MAHKNYAYYSIAWHPFVLLGLAGYGERKVIHCTDPANLSVQLTYLANSRPKGPMGVDTINTR